MSEPWTKSRCPRCERTSEDCRLEVEQHLEGTAFNVRHVHTIGNGSHSWSVRWFEETTVTV